MSVIHVKSPREYNKLKKEGLVIVDFNTEWCGPCRRFAPVYEKMASDYPDVTFLSVDAEQIEHNDCLEIKSVPTFKIFLNGELRRQFEGVDAEKIERYIERYSIQVLINGKLIRKFTPETIDKVTRYLKMFSYNEDNTKHNSNN